MKTTAETVKKPTINYAKNIMNRPMFGRGTIGFGLLVLGGIGMYYYYKRNYKVYAASSASPVNEALIPKVISPPALT